MPIKPPKVDVRCPACGRLLCQTDGDVIVDCWRCKGRVFFHYDTKASKYLTREEKNKFN